VECEQQMHDGITYRRPNRHRSHIPLQQHGPLTGTTADEFAKIWHAHVEPSLPGPAPKPEVRPDGDYSVALGVKQVNGQGTHHDLCVIHRGRQRPRAWRTRVRRRVDAVFREVITSLDTVKVRPSVDRFTAQTASTIDVDFDLPPGYVSERDGPRIVIKPATIDRSTPCVYGISPLARRADRSKPTHARRSLSRCPAGQIIERSLQSPIAGDGRCRVALLLVPHGRSADVPAGRCNISRRWQWRSRAGRAR
jgi:hypothetical protein